eukprot:9490934-Pyramimonas_sp.AAC.1
MLGAPGDRQEPCLRPLETTLPSCWGYGADCTGEDIYPATLWGELRDLFDNCEPDWKTKVGRA